jgi:DNA-binding NtrC family response regulator
MRTVEWKGPRAPQAVVDALDARDIGLAKGPATAAATRGTPAERRQQDLDGAKQDGARAMGPSEKPAAEEAPLIVFSSSGGRGGIGPDRNWIWLASRWPGDDSAREAVMAGAYDVIALDRPDALTQLVARIEELLAADPPMPDIEGLGLIAVSHASRRVLAQVARVAPTSMPVLLTGETGTGKEVLARLIHAWSPRHAKQFVPINCAAIPNELMEAELFGYARGAFSGAVQGYAGQLMAAAGGTVFMDEIDDTPLATQVKLLRVLEDRVVSRLGENEWHQVDFRILAATNRDLEPLIRDGAFGSDLYERLAIVRIQLVPLRERVEDLPDLARHFLTRFAKEQPHIGGARARTIRADALHALESYPWPGNIRELRNVIYETLVYKRAGEEILPADLPKKILSRESPLTTPAAAASDPNAPCIDEERIAARIATGTFNLRTEVAALQRTALTEALKRTGGNATKAARLLGTVGRGRSADPGGTVRAMARRFRIDN